MSTSQPLPDPMVPAEVDLRGLEYMPLLGAKLFASDFDLEATDAEFRRGLRLWWAAWNQVPAGSLPASERAQAKLAGFEDETSASWKRVKRRALDGFLLCSDGRLYHPVIASQAVIAWEKRQEDRDRRANEADRQRHVRAQRRELFEQLRQAGIRPKYDTPLSELRELVAQHASQPVTPPVTVTAPVTVTPPVTEPVAQTVPVTVTQTDTAKTGRDGNGIQQPIQGKPAPYQHLPLDAEAQAGAFDPNPGPIPTPAGQACRAMRAVGITAVNPSHPALIALLEAGATVPEFIAAAQSARDKRDPFAYVLATVAGQRKDAAAMAATVHRGPLPNRQEAIERRNMDIAERWAEGADP